MALRFKPKWVIDSVQDMHPCFTLYDTYMHITVMFI